jgi:uncharacterized membrane protein
MHRQVKRTGQAIHPVLAPAALGLLALGTALDVLAAGRAGALTWLSFWAIAGGIALGTWCAAFALLDWIFFAELGEAGVCGLDGFATALVVGLYGLAALLRLDAAAHAPPAAGMALEVAGAALLGMKTWIGRELAAWLDERR